MHLAFEFIKKSINRFRVLKEEEEKEALVRDLNDLTDGMVHT